MAAISDVDFHQSSIEKNAGHGREHLRLAGWYDGCSFRG
jgi:hypothetical protein